MNRTAMRVLVVCSGNTCRSPLAAAMLAASVATEPRLADVEVVSAGTAARSGAPASEGTYLVALERGLDLSSHRARLLSADDVQAADVILAMGREHLWSVSQLGGDRKAHLIREYAGEVPGVDVPDPFGGDVEGYRAAAAEFDRLLGRIMERLVRDRPRVVDA